MTSPLQLIISREYLSRVRRKSFIITTLLMPVLMIVLMVAPSLIMLLSPQEKTTVAVIDNSGIFDGQLRNNDDVKFVPFKESLDSARNNVDFDAILVVGKGVVDKPNESITMFYHGAPVLATDTYISNQLKDVIENKRLEAYNINNLREIMEEVAVDMNYPTIRMDAEEDSDASSILSFALGMAMDMLLYMFIVIYGSMVMNSIIEEKSNRVLEIVVSSVKPYTLMAGKIIGVGLVALTQIMIWIVLLASASYFLLPIINSMPAAGEDAQMSAIVSQISNPDYILPILGWMILFFIGGYLFYSAIFAAIGSAVDNVQDASQFTSIATIPVMIGMMCSMAVMQSPGSSIAVWISMIPLTSPMAMMSRLPFGVPLWQILLSISLLYASFTAMIWVCAKIYRVGIFMYGKKPTLIELIRWAQYK